MLLDHFKVFRVFFRLIEFSSGVVENAGVFGWHIEGLNIRLISKIPIRKLFILTSSFHPCVVFYDLAKNNKMAKYCFFGILVDLEPKSLKPQGRDCVRRWV